MSDQEPVGQFARMGRALLSYLIAKLADASSKSSEPATTEDLGSSYPLGSGNRIHSTGELAMMRGPGASCNGAVRERMTRQTWTLRRGC